MGQAVVQEVFKRIVLKVRAKFLNIAVRRNCRGFAFLQYVIYSLRMVLTQLYIDLSGENNEL
ncbi:hypothetical protein BKP35_00630 [Anaerobacillus arseniciselenatis]|uniref:Uncharacterized protein n=1 Tax=Anaerobacillus arseniciselenatis TaxID=85682 RepID=A0A1S2LSQ1_9BACI|nr:hypothetical protein BKP35_00630 [Anaerobacillus arseniciselenatis]